MNTQRVIPQCHEGNDEYYWKTIFPSYYIYRKVSTISFAPNLIIDGDVELSTLDNKNTLTCMRCCTQVSKLIPKLFGSIDTGKEFVYTCPNCKEIICRIYTPDDNVS